MTTDDARKILEHLRLYTTATALRTNSGLSAVVIAGLIESKRLNPLPAEHPDAIEGLAVLKIDEVQRVIRERNQSGPVRAATSRIHNYLRPQRRLRNHYLTNTETLNAIVKSMGASPIQQPFDIDDN
ncbi:hypothetical protein [Pseudomonas frederiksbergensis]|uniref:hypothetical protein n=1 Tax=Pseudomonas frederiksbergensis TaxID=104087 RepID=UPI0011CD598C|nr:hypothetical protein [Pseudomonas frederiksbergensis]